MKKEEILQIWRNSNTITNFNVGITEDEVLNRPAVIETKNAYYYRGEKVTLNTAPANCVVLQANQNGLPVYLLLPNTENTIKLNAGYIYTMGSPVKSSKYKTTLRDWVHFISPLSSVINLNSNNMCDKIKILDSFRYKDLRFSVFGKSSNYYEEYDFKTKKTKYIKHLNYQEMYSSNLLIHPTTRLLLENYNNNHELDENICAAISGLSPYFTKTISTTLLEVGWTKGLYKFLLKRGSKGKKQNKTSKSVIDVLCDLPDKIFHNYQGTLLIKDSFHNNCFLWGKHSWIQYRYDGTINKRFCVGKKSQMNLGYILNDIYCNVQDTDVTKYYDEFIQVLPLIYKIGNYKYTLGYFMDKTNWVNLSISSIIKLYIMTRLLRHHPNDHLVEMLIKQQIDKCPSVEIVHQQFEMISEKGMEWYLRKKHYDYKVGAYIHNTRPFTVKEYWEWFFPIWEELQEGREYGPFLNNYPFLRKYMCSLKKIIQGYDSFTPTWQYKNIQAQLHMSFSMFKGFLKENPFTEGSMALENWKNVTDRCTRVLVCDEQGNIPVSLPEKIKIISSITYGQYKTLASVYDSAHPRAWPLQLRYLHEAIYGKNNIITVTSLCKAITIFQTKFPNTTLGRVEELMRQVSSPNRILRRTECPILLSQCNYNYISNWIRREDVCHLVEMIKRVNPTSGDYWQSKFELLRNNKISLESYLLVLHNFYAEVDQYLHQEAVLLEEAELNKKFLNVSSELDKYKYSDDKLLIRPAKDIGELQNEGQTLNHCVFGFRTKMAEKQSFIFFIRNKVCDNVPYYTVELKNDSPKWIRQVHGKGNSQPTPEIVSFLKKWVAKFKFNPDVKDTYNALG